VTIERFIDDARCYHAVFVHVSRQQVSNRTSQ
jgi:hypothetical protein